MFFFFCCFLEDIVRFQHLSTILCKITPVLRFSCAAFRPSSRHSFSTYWSHFSAIKTFPSQRVVRRNAAKNTLPWSRGRALQVYSIHLFPSLVLRPLVPPRTQLPTFSQHSGRLTKHVRTWHTRFFAVFAHNNKQLSANARHGAGVLLKYVHCMIQYVQTIPGLLTSGSLGGGGKLVQNRKTR